MKNFMFSTYAYVIFVLYKIGPFSIIFLLKFINFQSENILYKKKN